MRYWPMRNQKRNKADPEEICRLAKEGISAQRIAVRLGVKVQTVRNIASQNGLQVLHRKSLRQSYGMPSTWTKE